MKKRIFRKEEINGKLIPEGIESEVRLDFFPIGHKMNYRKYEYFEVSIHTMVVKNFDLFPPAELIVEGFEKNGVRDFGAYQRGYSFYTVHPIYGKIEIARGYEVNKAWECDKFESLRFLASKQFKLLDYNDQQVLERDIETYFNFLKFEIKKFTTNFNKAVKNKMGESELNSDQIMNNLRNKINIK